MSRRIAVVPLVFLALLVVGLIFSSLQKARLNASLVGSRNNLRELALFAHHYAEPDPRKVVAPMPKEIPAGTVVLPRVPPEDRLSWVVTLLPVLDQRRQDTAALDERIDRMKPWSADANQAAGRTRLVVLLCPGYTPQVAAEAPAITCYVGISGLAPPDPATISLADGAPAPPRAGAFRYDAATPFDRVTDGLSQTLLLGESADSPGPWLRGGFSTLRGLDDSANAKPLVGGQFGGFFATGAHFALCDGGVRLFTPRTTPGVLLGLGAIADGAGGALPID